MVLLLGYIRLYNLETPFESRFKILLIRLLTGEKAGMSLSSR